MFTMRHPFCGRTGRTVAGLPHGSSRYRHCFTSQPLLHPKARPHRSNSRSAGKESHIVGSMLIVGNMLARSGRKFENYLGCTFRSVDCRQSMLFAIKSPISSGETPSGGEPVIESSILQASSSSINTKSLGGCVGNFIPAFKHRSRMDSVVSRAAFSSSIPVSV